MTIRVTDYGAVPDSGKDATPAVQSAIAAAAAAGKPVVLAFPPGRYDFYPEHAVRAPHYISNTTSEEENPDVTKTFGLLFEEARDLTIEGNGSLLVFHGKMTMIAFIGCVNIEVRNVRFDYARPTMSEMTVEAAGRDYLDVRVHPDSWYAIEEDRLIWVGEGWRYHDGPAQLYEPRNHTTWRVPNPVSAARRAEERGPNRLRLHYDRAPEASAGQVYQMRDGIRDQVGAFLCRSRNIVFRQVDLHYMHGLGIVGQFSENLVFDRIRVTPRSESGRTAAAFADCLHLSGCRGRIAVTDCLFEGAHDDAINVHGTHLRILERPAPNRLLVRFMHGQTYGFDAFVPGDEIELIRADTLAAFGSNRVVQIERRSPREMVLTLAEPVTETLQAGDVVENVTWTPEVDIRGNRFACIPTRGILLTTRRRTRIERNVFERTAMSAILLADDAGSWYESGRIADMTIHGNRFIECGSPVIHIHPENTVIDEDQPVHRNIDISDNQFIVQDGLVLDAKSAQGIRVRDNRIENASRGGAGEDDRYVRLTACPNAVLEQNTVGGKPGGLE